MQGPYLGASTSAQSIFEMSFEVTSLSAAVLSLNISRYWHDYPQPQVDFSLTSLAHGNIMTLGQIWNQQYDTLLEPDVYFLRFNVFAGTVPDPFGDLQGVDYSLNVNITPTTTPEVVGVPEPGTTIGLLGLGLLGLAGYRKQRRQAAVR
ncbi:MAG: VPDSG-CTERM sorting domain-containing protein [Opitutaceae bacterium]|nr:VPDSG-CTERM sorting domain-containing protein [Verrucomicrobiales bacterium]